MNQLVRLVRPCRCELKQENDNLRGWLEDEALNAYWKEMWVNACKYWKEKHDEVVDACVSKQADGVPSGNGKAEKVDGDERAGSHSNGA